MRVVIALIIGLAIGAAAVYFYSSSQGKSNVRSTGEQIESATKSARDSIQDKLREWNLQPESIKEDLSRTGRVVRQKAQAAGQAIADSTADARITGIIKGKLLANKDLSVLSISVNTTDGVVTLSGSVDSPDDISKAMVLALDNDGVREVISTLQVRTQKNGKI
jgi:hyperosmotically inducible protein